ncbi:MAG TPA: PIN domain-containing protein [Verrucomicrobiae bacterium]|nr:PIN domain-containing protein [Verrucomicrobiae bacterium]
MDTNTLSELSRPAPFPEVLEWLDSHESETAISAVSIGEMALGIERIPDGKRRRSLERAFGFLRQDYAGKILDFTEGVAVEWARLVATAQKQGRILSVIDSQIEATAVHFGLTVVTRNEKDFYHPVLNPWTQD